MEVAGDESAPIENSSSDCTAAIVVPVQPHFRTGIWLYWRDLRPCSLISCFLLAQIHLLQPPCHSLYITYYFMIGSECNLMPEEARDD